MSQDKATDVKKGSRVHEGASPNAGGNQDVGTSGVNKQSEESPGIVVGKVVQAPVKTMLQEEASKGNKSHSFHNNETIYEKEGILGRDSMQFIVNNLPKQTKPNHW